MDVTALLQAIGAGSQTAGLILIAYLVFTVRSLSEWAKEHAEADRKIAMSVAKIAGKMDIDLEN